MFSSVDTCWVLVAAFLVYFMQAGFALCEAGFTRAKNTGNILMKNMMDFCIGTPCYWLIGFGLMFGGTGALIGGFDPFIQGDYSHLGLDIPLWVYIVFQTVFCATAATIVSGSMAERTNFKAYCVYSAAISLVVYPICGHWMWGGGWLQSMGFHDFAGSAAVHNVGGVIALLGAAMLGPRIGKYGKDGFDSVYVLFGKFPYVHAHGGSFHKVLPVGYIVSELNDNTGCAFGYAACRHVQVLSVDNLGQNVGVNCREGVFKIRRKEINYRSGIHFIDNSVEYFTIFLPVFENETVIEEQIYAFYGFGAEIAVFTGKFGNNEVEYCVFRSAAFPRFDLFGKSFQKSVQNLCRVYLSVCGKRRVVLGFVNNAYEFLPYILLSFRA